MKPDNPLLDESGLQRFQELRSAAIEAVTERFYATHGSAYAHFGPKGRDACREDLGYHLEFLRPVLEFGLTQPMVDYLRWLATVLATRDVPAAHLPLSLDWLADFFAGGMTGQDGQIVATALQKAKARYLEDSDAAPAIYDLMPEPWPESEGFESALLAGDRHAAEKLLDGLLAQGRSLVEAETHVIQPALYGIGRKWQANRVSVAQEHLATAIAQALMARGLIRSAVPPSNGRKALLACVAGNNHSVGLQMVADGLQLAGWEVQNLGANVPTIALVQHTGHFQPHLLGLSVSFAQQLRVVKEIMTQLTRAQGKLRPAVMVGGLALNQFSLLAEELGVDAWSPDACAAIETASRQKPQPVPV